MWECFKDNNGRKKGSKIDPTQHPEELGVVVREGCGDPGSWSGAMTANERLRDNLCLGGFGVKVGVSVSGEKEQ